MPTNLNRIKLWSIAGGKGGIGKSLVSLGLGVALARLGKKVILIDGDLGGANLHTLMGVRYPHVTLEHFLTKKVTRLEDTVIETSVEGINLICGADDLMGSANPTFAQKVRLLQQIEDLPGGGCILSMKVSSTLEMTPWIRGWGPDVEVLEPADLREQFRKWAKELSKMYS